MLKLTTPLALAAAGALVFAAPGSAVVGPAAKTKKIAVKDNRFSPKTLTIKKGTKLDWVWKGDNPHNVRFGKHKQQDQDPRLLRRQVPAQGDLQDLLLHPP